MTYCAVLLNLKTDLRFLVFDPVGFVNHQVPPVELLEHCLLDDEHLVRRDAHIPLTWKQHVSNEGRLKLKDVVFK